MPAAIRCPSCGHALVTLDLPEPFLPATEPQSSSAPLLLRVSEAARLLGVSRSTMYQLVASGSVPVIRIGRSVRVSRPALEAWIRTAT